MLDIQKMITMSTAHVSEKTAKVLDIMAINVAYMHGVNVYAKDDVGWFIYCAKNTPYNNIPEEYDDLRKVIEFAHDHDCEVICLDGDYEPIDYLPKYEW